MDIELSNMDFIPEWAKKSSLIKEQTYSAKFPKSTKGKKTSAKKVRNEDELENTKPHKPFKRNPNVRKKSSWKGNRSENWQDKKNRNFHNRNNYQSEQFDFVEIDLIPKEQACQQIAEHIKTTLHSFSAMQITKAILSDKNRFSISIKIKPKTQDKNFYVNKTNGDIWLDKNLASQNLLNSKYITKFYQIIEKETPAPKGNFNSIAICGISGKAIAPHNYHKYQSLLNEFHQQFGKNMSFEKYKSRIKSSRETEDIEAWKDTQKTIKVYIPKNKISPDYEDNQIKQTTPTPEQPKESTTNSTTNDNSNPNQNPNSEEPTEIPEKNAGENNLTKSATPTETETKFEDTEINSTPTKEENQSEEHNNSENSENSPPQEQPETETTEPKTTSEEAPEVTQPAIELKTQAELSIHFADNYFDQAFDTTTQFEIPAAKINKKLPQNLARFIRNELRKKQNFPVDYLKIACEKLRKQGVKIFKINKNKVFIGPAMPKLAPSLNSLSKTSRDIITFISKNPKSKVIDLLSEFKLIDKTNKTEVKFTATMERFLNDLKWLIASGYIIEFPNTALEIAKQNIHTANS